MNRMKYKRFNEQMTIKYHYFTMEGVHKCSLQPSILPHNDKNHT